MKRFAILTSVMALAACGGGSGGVSDGLTPAQREAVESNKQITGMLTYIETDGAGNTLNSRSASTRESGVRQTAASYDLSDVDFIMADEGFDGKIQFDVDEESKKIVGLTVLGDENDPEDTDKYFNRDETTNVFEGLVNVGHDDVLNQPIYANGRLVYTSVANRERLGLRYADFGNVKVNIYNDETNQYEPEQSFVFIGGYDGAKKIDESGMNTDVTFNGRATGGVVAVLHGNNTGEFLDLDTSTNASDSDKVATLNFNNGVKTLNAKFDNWYDLTYTETGDTKSASFSNYTNDNNDFRMISETGDSFTMNVVSFQECDDQGHPIFDEHNNPVTAENMNSEFRFYGDGGVPSESVALIQIRDRGTDPDNYENINDYGNGSSPRPEVRMNLSFGGKVE